MEVYYTEWIILHSYVPQKNILQSWLEIMATASKIGEIGVVHVIIISDHYGRMFFQNLRVLREFEAIYAGRVNENSN